MYFHKASSPLELLLRILMTATMMAILDRQGVLDAVPDLWLSVHSYLAERPTGEHPVLWRAKPSEVVQACHAGKALGGYCCKRRFPYPWSTSSCIACCREAYPPIDRNCGPQRVWVRRWRFPAANKLMFVQVITVLASEIIGTSLIPDITGLFSRDVRPIRSF